MATALFVAASVVVVRRGVVTRVRLLYWQHRCATWDGPITMATVAEPVPWPPCFRSLWQALSESGCNVGPSFFDGRDEPLVFLHERTSRGGTRRLIAMEFRSNVSHAQLCSVDCLVLDAATLTSPVTGTAKVAAWVPGYWANVSRDSLKPSVADPSDPSHFTFSYDASVPAHPSGTFDDLDFDPTTRAASERHLITRTVDGWLLDDATVRVEYRSPGQPPLVPTPVLPAAPHRLEPLGPPRS